jgi:hypothetical protein
MMVPHLSGKGEPSQPAPTEPAGDDDDSDAAG